jgi:hypothetical protein
VSANLRGGSTGEAEPDLDFERDDPPLWPDEAIVATLAEDRMVSVGGAVSAAAATVEGRHTASWCGSAADAR